VRISRELRVDAPAERAWRALLDVPQLAGALGEADVDPRPVDGGWRGTLHGFAGTARVLDVDDDEHRVSLHLQGRRPDAGRAVAATVALLTAGEDGATRVAVEADVTVTGDAPGGAELEAATAALLDRLAGALAGELEVSPTTAATPAPPDAAPFEPGRESSAPAAPAPPAAAAPAPGPAARAAGIAADPRR
jgi:carbon monoxide dehydrogenase subunit G